MKKSFLYAAMAASCMLLACNPEKNNPEGPGTDPVTPDEPSVSYDMLFTEIKTSPVTESMELEAECCSPNHKYMAGINTWTYLMAIWNVETGEVKELPEEYQEGALHAISNEGVAVGSSKKWVTEKPDWWDDEWYGPFEGMPSNEAYPIIYKNGKVEWLPMPSNCISGEAYCISEDGSVIGGFCFDEMYNTIAVLWNADGSTSTIDVPQNYGIELDPFTEVRHMSSDASVLLGFVRDANTGDWPVCVWKKNGGNYEMVLSACELGWGSRTLDETTWEPIYQGKYATADGESGAAVSANGKYVAVLLTTPDDENWCHETYVATVDLTTKEVSLSENLTPTEDSAQARLSIIAVADNGTVLGYQEAGGFGPMPLALGEGREAFVIEAGSSEIKSLSEVPGADRLASYASVTPVWMAYNCSALAGFATTEAGQSLSFVIY